ncbi:helix-turn-helix domain-containing protein [Nocardia sp. NPDC049220]|uniref:helix-turn-helix domain-containing protein n=1 Tax=Nocardia sp. NPDC049220 TaxID=3155273 RepID=UPI003404309C
MDQNLATPAEVATYLRTTTARLANDRYHGVGIPYVKYGRNVLYRWQDIRDWIERNTLCGTADRPGAA